MARDTTDTIYVELLNEGVKCWRPAEALYLRQNVYKLPSPIADETWAFVPGSTVRVQKQAVGADPELVLVEVETVDGMHLE